MAMRWYGEQLIARARQGALNGVTAWIGMVEERAVGLIMNPPKSGRIYTRRGIKHQASAPGEAPANDTGALVSGRTVEIIPERLAGRLTFTAKHAKPLEDGTRNMEPRPFAKRALFETEAMGRERLISEIGAMLR